MKHKKLLPRFSQIIMDLVKSAWTTCQPRNRIGPVSNNKIIDRPTMSSQTWSFAIMTLKSQWHIGLSRVNDMWVEYHNSKDTSLESYNNKLLSSLQSWNESKPAQRACWPKIFKPLATRGEGRAHARQNMRRTGKLALFTAVVLLFSGVLGQTSAASVGVLLRVWIM